MADESWRYLLSDNLTVFAQLVFYAALFDFVIALVFICLVSMHGWYFYPCDLESNEEKDNNSSTIQEDDIALKKYSEQGTANTGREISRNVVETAAGAEDFVELENSVPNGNSSINLTVQCELAQDGHFSIVVNDSSSERESEDHNDTNDTKNQNEKILKISFVQRHENHVVDIALFSGAFVLFSLAAARLSN